GGGPAFVGDEHGGVGAVAPDRGRREQLAAARYRKALELATERVVGGRRAAGRERASTRRIPSLPATATRSWPSSTGALEPRSVSLLLSSAWLVGVKDWRRLSDGKVSSSTLSPKSLLPFHGALPVSIRMRLPPGSTTAPPRERIAESLAGQLLGTSSSRRPEQSVLKTRVRRALERSIATRWPW